MGTSLSANYNDENSDINIRGIDSQAGTSTTAIYIDDTPIQTRHIGFGSVNPFPALFDLDHVEVLRGPQGTLFGAGAEGGAVRFITPDPGLNTYTGYARSEVSSIDYGGDSYNAGAAVGGPLIDGVLGFRISGSTEHDGGWVDRVSYTHPIPDPLIPPEYASTTEPNANHSSNGTARLALKWQPTESFSVIPSIYFQHLQVNDTAAYWMNLSDAAAGIYRDGDALTNPSSDWFWVAALKLDYRLSFADLTSDTSYFQRQQRSISDYTQYFRSSILSDPYPVDNGGGTDLTPFGDDQGNFYQEFRLSSLDAQARLKWTAGIFFQHLRENVRESSYDTVLASTVFGCDPTTAVCQQGLLFDLSLDQTVDQQIASFGDLTAKVTDSLSVTVGMRVSRDEVRTISEASGGLLISNPGVVTRASESATPVTPKAVLTWQPRRDEMVYLSAAKGYRDGGTNAPSEPSLCTGDLLALGLPVGSNGLPIVPGRYQPDSLWSYELGSKVSVLDRRLTINSSVFLIRWSNIQQSVYLPDCGGEFTANQGEVLSRGGDIDVQYRPFEMLDLGLTASYTDAKYLENACAGASSYDGTACVSGTGITSKPIASEGDRLLGAPWNIHLSSELHHPVPLFGDGSGYLRLDYQITTAQNALLAGQDASNAFFDSTIPGLPLTKNLDARLGLRFKGFDISVFGQNLTNEHPLVFLSRDIPPVIPGTPLDNLYFGRSVQLRTVGVTGTYHF
jgi:outer membrane receptor protein involved in Fe transport